MNPDIVTGSAARRVDEIGIRTSHIQSQGHVRLKPRPLDAIPTTNHAARLSVVLAGGFTHPRGASALMVASFRT
jgi:hypothetical protein